MTTLTTPRGRPVIALGDASLMTMDRFEEFGRWLDSDPRIVTASLVANPHVRTGWLRASAPAGPVVLVALDAVDLVGPIGDDADAVTFATWARAASERGLWHDWALTNSVDVARTPLFLDPSPVDADEALSPSSAHFEVAQSHRAPRLLRIAVDATWLGPHETGAQVLTTAAVAALARSERVAQIVLTGVAELPAYAKHLTGSPKVVVASPEDVYDRADIVWYPNQIDGRSNIAAARDLGKRVITTYLDLIAYDIPRYHGSAEAWAAYRALQRTIALSVDGITTISADVAHRLLLEVPRLDSERVQPLPLGLDHIAATDVPDAPDSDLAKVVSVLGDRRFIAVLGNDFQHKNRDFAIATWERLLADGHSVDLVLAGLHVKGSSSKAGEEALLAKHANLRGRVHSVGHVSSASRAWLLANATAVHYPSSAEGFGFVPYEAAAFGTPSTFTDFGPLREVSGVAGLPARWTVETHAADLARLLSDDQAAADRVAALHQAIARLTWDGFAEGLIDFFLRISAMPVTLTSTVAGSAADSAALAGILQSRSYRVAQRLQRLRPRRK